MLAPGWGVAFLKLIQTELSLYSFKVTMALRLKGVDLPAEAPPGGSYKSEAFKAINPAGSVPTLVDGDFWLTESDAIIEYLEDRSLGAPIHDPDPRRRARARMLSRWLDLRLEPALRALFPFVRQQGRPAEDVASSRERIAAALGLIEQAMDPTGPFATGQAPGLADCGLVANAIWLEVLEPRFGLDVRPGPRFRRAAAAMESDGRLTGPVGLYRRRAADWATP
jgi:glutathione S-transferase